jgi:hypothetical protein
MTDTMHIHSTTPSSSASTERDFTCAFVAFSFLAILLGAVAMRAADASPGLWLRNPLAWVVALALCAGLRRLRLPPPWVLELLAAVLALTLFAPGQEGVHRWLGAGPVQLNVAALVLPFALVLADRAVRRDGRRAHALAVFAMAGILAWQPDMSQLVALVAALLAWAGVQRSGRALRWIVPVALAALLVCAYRPDPLDPVPYVEGILHLAAGVSPVLALGCGLCLLLACLSPLVLLRDADRRPVAAALAAYFLVSGFAWLFGAFPVPLAGYGLSFILGWMAGATALLMQ